jgi:hypothetical protein
MTLTPTNRPIARIVVHADRLQAGLSMTIDDILSKDVRAHAFMLEGLLRLYRMGAKGKDKKRLDKQLDHLKEIEDAIGALGYAIDMAAAAGSSRQDKAKAKQSIDDERVNLSAVLAAWSSPARIDGVVAAMAKLDAVQDHDNDRESRHVRKCLRAMIDDIDDDIAELDMDDLEEGIHELRRQLRWIPIVMIALGGLVVLDASTDPIPSLAGLKTSPLATSRFGQLPTSAIETDPIAVPQSLFLELSRIIGVLGEIKDRGQRAEHSSSSQDMAFVHAEGHALFDVLQETRLLTALRRSLKRV